MSIFSDIENALSAYTNLLGMPTAWQNTLFEPTLGTLYIRPSLLPAKTQPLVMSDYATDKHSGIYQIDIIAPVDQGRRLAVVKADEIADHFQRGTDLNSGSTTTTVMSVSRGVGIRDGAWFVIPVEINFIAYT
ncbi:MAG TPA: hypothetical protein EYF94_02655 [Porticoccaceae bacterium]|jgi:hypothetical protein|nr:hypothetical protein [Methylococcaceae bacterium]HIK79820.1 hypothetical protein [Porticoccaceae bacterium]